MPKALCLIGLVFSALVFLIFLADIGLGLAGSEWAPLRLPSLLMELLFLLSAGGLAFISWKTYREQR
jgi:hypothetical protein